MIELPDRIDMAHSYAESVSVQAPGFWGYAEGVIRDWCNGADGDVLRCSSAFHGTYADRNLRAILRGQLRWPS
jgi:hypothetical protein